MTNSTQERGNKCAFGVEPSQRRYKLRLARYKALAETVGSFVTERKAKRPLDLLDIGLGKGRSLRYIEAAGKADQIVFSGVDLKQRRLASVYAPNRWKLLQADIQTGLPFKSQCFDIVICEQVLEHLVDPNIAIREMNRVLRPDGLLIVGVPIFPPVFRLLRKMGVWISMNGLGIAHSHIQTFDSRSFKRMLLEHNSFSIQTVVGFRIASGGLIAPLEDYWWWYRFNQFLGRLVPSLCTEIQVTARKNGRSSETASEDGTISPRCR